MNARRVSLSPKAPIILERKKGHILSKKLLQDLLFHRYDSYLSISFVHNT